MMNKKELTKLVAEQLGVTQKVALDCIDAVVDGIIIGALTEGEVNLSGFGKFSIVDKEEREGRNPQTGEPITIPARRNIKFKAATALKEEINA